MTDLADLFQIEAHARRAADEVELGFVAANETFRVVPYRQAVLWVPAEGVVAVSGAPSVASDAPFIRWLGDLFASLGDGLAKGETRDVTVEDCRDELRVQWAEWLPAHALVVPWRDRRGRLLAAALFAFDEPPTDDSRRLLAYVCDVYAHALAALRPSTSLRDRLSTVPIGKRLLIGGAIAVAVLAFPIRMSVIAPADVVAIDPFVVRSPLDGVLENFHVTPNAKVENGHPLFDLDPTSIEVRIETARSALAVAEAEYRQAAQQAIFDQRAKSQLPSLQGKAQERKEELTYLASLLERSRVKAPRDGVVLMDDPTLLLGRPVQVGERVIQIVDERKTEIEAWLPVGDLLDFEPDAEMRLFLNVDPTAPLDARLRLLSYEPVSRPDGSLAYRMKGSFADAARSPRVGLRGTVRVDGPRASLFYFLVRRPLVVLRQTLGI